MPKFLSFAGRPYTRDEIEEADGAFRYQATPEELEAQSLLADPDLLSYPYRDVAVLAKKGQYEGVAAGWYVARHAKRGRWHNIQWRSKPFRTRNEALDMLDPDWRKKEITRNVG